ncbi:MAG TPA: hypothetical protein P5099_02955 [Candidatus Moranbacteria bacterium]|nr:hypothetical protein [Candidatus Moranbacteria bacterium]
MLLTILKIIVSFLLAYWLAAAVLAVVGFFVFKKNSPKSCNIFIWILISAIILSLVFHSTRYFNAYAALIAAIIQTYKVIIKDNKFYIGALAFFLGWFLTFIVLLYFK